MVENRTSEKVSLGAKRGAASVHDADASALSVDQEIAIELKDDAAGSFVSYIFRDSPEDAAKLIGKYSYRYTARIREIKDKVIVLDRPCKTTCGRSRARPCVPSRRRSSIPELRIFPSNSRGSAGPDQRSSHSPRVRHSPRRSPAAEPVLRFHRR